MENLKLFDGELKFMQIIWANEPMTSRRLVELCAEKLGWKQSTTYTVLKKLSVKGAVKNDNSTVTSLIKQEQARRYESESVVDRAFGGSLPGFVAAFMSGRGISEAEAEEIKAMIDRYREAHHDAD